MDLCSLMVSVLAILTTVLIGWNIYTVLDIRVEWKELKSKWEKSYNEMNEIKEQIALEKYNQRAWTNSVGAQSCLLQKNYYNAFNYSMQALYNMLYDADTNMKLDNFNNLHEWFCIILSNKDKIEMQDVEYLNVLLKGIREHPNYFKIRDKFNGTLNEVEILLNK